MRSARLPTVCHHASLSPPDVSMGVVKVNNFVQVFQMSLAGGQSWCWGPCLMLEGGWAGSGLGVPVQ